MPLYAQVLRNPPPAVGAEPEALPPYRTVRPQPTAELNATIKRMHESVKKLQQADLNPAQKQAALDELIRDHNYILRQHDTWIDWQKPQTVDSAALLLEKVVFQEAVDLAPTEQSREQVLRNAPQHLELDPNQPQVAKVYEPPLLAPADPPVAQELPQSTAGPSASEATEAGATAKSSAPASDKPEVTDDEDIDKKVQVAVLADDQTTTDLHDDNTVLRDITNDKGELVFFGKLHLWAGGALQLDAYVGDGLFTQAKGGSTETKSYLRRGEGILRASVFDNGEVKAQYDFDTKEFRDLYWRWVSDNDSHSVTIGNQKEPMGQDYMVGSKFTTAMEPSAPTTAFGGSRSKGIRYNGATPLESGDNPFKFWGDSRTFMTGSIGLFGEDIENTNDTDWAVTGRVTIGGNKTGSTGYHLGASASYRHGEFDRIAPRPGLQDVNRINLAAPESDTVAMAGLEFMFTGGSLHSQGELYYSDYSGGEVDAEGWGGYGQVGWLFGGKRRFYRPNWGLWAPIDASKEHVFEVFARASLTHGNDDVNSSNELGLLTLGGNWYYREFRVSANVLLADTKRDVSSESTGYAGALRFQYLF
jgi:phosphate-selective porin